MAEKKGNIKMKTNKAIRYLGLMIAVFFFILGGQIIFAQVSADEEIAVDSSSMLSENVVQGLRFNFRGVSINKVLNYFSKAVGYTVILEVVADDKINMWSYRPLNENEAVSLLDTILKEKGYAAIRQGRTLKVVDIDDAKKYGLRVEKGINSNLIPESDEMVTYILPVRYADAVQLLGNIKDLLPSYAVVTANVSSNSIVITDTQTNIKRIAKIIEALDTSIVNISMIQIFMLQYADATDLANVISKIFQMDASDRNRRGNQNFLGQAEDGDESSSSNSGSIALQIASRIVAVADQHTNSLVISAPESIMPTIVGLVEKIDIVVYDPTLVQIFPLYYSDAIEMAQMITDVFQQNSQSNLGVRRFLIPQTTTRPTSARKIQEDQIVAVADIRTNSVVVTAAGGIMLQVEQMVLMLDAGPSRKKNVYIYEIENMGLEELQVIFEGIFIE